MNLFVLTGPVHSGKTTRLTKWIEDKNVRGILAPVIDGCRYLKDIKCNEIKKLEIESSSPVQNSVSIGNYYFDEDVFEWARNRLLYSFKQKPDWLIVDEIGPLEIKGKGLEPAIGKILCEIKENPTANLVIIVRDYLYDIFLLHYNFPKEKIEILNI